MTMGTKATPTTSSGPYGLQQLTGPPAHPAPVPLKNGQRKTSHHFSFEEIVSPLTPTSYSSLKRSEGFT